MDAVGELDMGVVWVKSVASATPQTRHPGCAGRSFTAPPWGDFR